MWFVGALLGLVFGGLVLGDSGLLVGALAGGFAAHFLKTRLVPTPQDELESRVAVLEEDVRRLRHEVEHLRGGGAPAAMEDVVAEPIPAASVPQSAPAPAFAALPYMLHLGLTHTDAYFEAVSGLTATGATVLSGLDTLPMSINLWRHLTMWFGGMGLIVLAVAILPLLGIGGRQMFKAETPGPMKDSKMTPRIAETAKGLWLVYIGITVLCILAYRWAGMGWFDAVCHTFSTVSLGGFSTHDASIGHFASAQVEYVAIFFMLFSGIHSVYGGGKQQAKEAVIVKQVKVGGGPVCLSENIPLVFYDSSMSIVEVIASGAESKTGQLIISGNFGTVACERFDLFNGKSIIPIPELEPGFYTIELSIDKNVFAGDFFIE